MTVPTYRAQMKRHRGTRPRSTRKGVIVVDALVPNPEAEQVRLPDQILGFALDQRVFGPRQLMVAFAAYDGRFLALTYTPRTNPVETALVGCLRHFDALGRGGEVYAAAVVLCDEPVADGPIPPDFMAKFLRAQDLAGRHGVHLVDWISCDDDLSGAHGCAPSHRRSNLGGGIRRGGPRPRDDDERHRPRASAPQAPSSASGTTATPSGRR